MENKEFWKGLAAGVLVSVVIGAGGYLGYTLAAPHTVLTDKAHVEKLQYLESMIDQYYLGEKDEDALAEGVYTGLLYGLGDPYSTYYTAQEYKAENTSTEGAYVGIGVVMEKNKEGGVKIVECYEGGPGEAAGLEKDDIISAVDGTDITEFATSQVADLIQKSESGSVTLMIHRENVEETMDITVSVEDVQLPTVFHEMLDKETGYIRITEFKGVTYNQYMDAFTALEENGMKKLVVDLRDNPGGLLPSVCDILNQILPEGLIVYMEDKYGNREEKRSDGEHPLDIPLVVLVNGGSASASEIFAGAVKDYGIGTIVGTTTYGKGVVQSIRPLEDGSAVKLTISNYYTPKGNNIHKVGIEPDVVVKLDANLLNKEKISHEEDNQLQEALKVLEK